MTGLFQKIITGIAVVIALFMLLILPTAIGLGIGYVVQLTPLGDFIHDAFGILGLDTAGKLHNIGAVVGFIAGILNASKISFNN